MQKTKVLVRVINRKSPYQGLPRGTYLQAALPNDAGRAFGKVIMSYEKPYKMWPDSLVESQVDVHRAVAQIQRKFHVEWA
jgi:hypothetical protein